MYSRKELRRKMRALKAHYNVKNITMYSDYGESAGPRGTLTGPRFTNFRLLGSNGEDFGRASYFHTYVGQPALNAPSAIFYGMDYEEAADTVAPAALTTSSLNTTVLCGNRVSNKHALLLTSVYSFRPRLRRACEYGIINEEVLSEMYRAVKTLPKYSGCLDCKRVIEVFEVLLERRCNIVKGVTR